MCGECWVVWLNVCSERDYILVGRCRCMMSPIYFNCLWQWWVTQPDIFLAGSLVQFRGFISSSFHRLLFGPLPGFRQRVFVIEIVQLVFQPLALILWLRVCRCKTCVHMTKKKRVNEGATHGHGKKDEQKCYMQMENTIFN